VGEDCGVVEGGLSLLLAMATTTTINTATTRIARPATTHAGVFEEVGGLAGGGHPARGGANTGGGAYAGGGVDTGGADTGGPDGPLGGRDCPTGRERTVGIWGGVGGVLPGAAVGGALWVRFWACSMA
jgi:hypothetical protein